MPIDVFTMLELRSGDAPIEACRTYLDRCGIERMLVAPAIPGGPRDEFDLNCDVLDHCASDPRLAPLYTALPADPHSFPRVMRGALATEPFAGVWVPLEAATHPDQWTPALEAAAEAGVPVFLPLDSTPASVLRASLAARKCSRVACVLCCPREGPWAAAAEAVAQARERADASLFVATANAMAEDVRVVLRTAPADRVVFASGNDFSAIGISAAATLLDSLRQTLAPQVFASLTRTNASTLFIRNN